MHSSKVYLFDDIEVHQCLCHTQKVTIIAEKYIQVLERQDDVLFRAGLGIGQRITEPHIRQDWDNIPFQKLQKLVSSVPIDYWEKK